MNIIKNIQHLSILFPRIQNDCIKHIRANTEYEKRNSPVMVLLKPQPDCYIYPMTVNFKNIMTSYLYNQPYIIV